MKKFNTLLIFLFVLAQWLPAQRYVSEVFTEVEVTDSVLYGVNATVLAVSVFGEAVPQPLLADVYEPKDDTLSERPLIVMLHTGNFLPPTNNGGCGGTIKDADMVTNATRLAKMGYVVAVADYRLGWNPISSDQNVRVFTLINAAYRGMQDARMAARYFRRTIAENDNPFGVDGDKFTVMGFGTGGYIAYAAATLDTVTDTYVPKFFANGVPMIIESVNGNVDGTTVGIVPAGYPGFPEGDTLNYPNHVGYSSEYNLAVNLGGALGDSSWIDAGDIPMVSFHVTTDPFAPCGVGDVIVPPPLNLTVVEVIGSCGAQPIINRKGINDIFTEANFIDDITQYASSVNGGIEGFFPFFSNDRTESAPWNFTFSAEPYGVDGSDCDTDAASAGMAMDSILTYLAPRACVALELGCDLSDFVVSTRDLTDTEVGLSLMPNPASQQVIFRAEKSAIQQIALYDIAGRLASHHGQINDYQFELQRNRLAKGMYIAQIQFEEGTISKKIIFE